jgi:trimeric autotransporter adhesin
MPSIQPEAHRNHSRKILLPFLAVFLLSVVAPAQSIQYQARLTDPDTGVPKEGLFTITFSLYDDAEGDIVYWTESKDLTVVNGLISTVLGDINPLPTVVFDSRDLWLGVQVGTDDEALPRQKIMPVIYSIFALNAGKAMTLNGLDASQFATAQHEHNAENITTGTLNEAVIPASIARVSNLMTNLLTQDGSGSGLDADLLDGMDSNAFWKRGGNIVNERNFIGTISAHPFVLIARDQEVIELEYPTGTDSPNIIGGHAYVASGVYGATIGGGGRSVAENRIYGIFGTIGGGEKNEAGTAGELFATSFATVGGGSTNRAFSAYAFIGGGGNNQVEGQYGSIGGGNANALTANYAAISGGFLNQVTGQYAFIGGGWQNINSSAYATIGGGESNLVFNTHATIGGGYANSAENTYTTIGGGYNNTAQGESATVGGGRSNVAYESYSAISGGMGNGIYNVYGSITGGEYNEVRGDHGAIGGGQFNVVNGEFAVIGGGSSNQADGYAAFAGSGANNQANGAWSSVAGGLNNTASNSYAMIPGGASNLASGQTSFAAGNRAKATHNGAFVWGDYTAFDVNSDRNNQVKFRAAGGMHLIANSTSGLSPAALRVESSSSIGVGMFINQTSSDANLVMANPGTGMLVKAYSGTGGANLVFRVENDGATHAKSFTPTSDRNAKENFAPVDTREILDKVAELPLSIWNFKGDDADTRHLGPMAQDFHATFGLGDTDTGIATVDLDGVALAAIQGLNSHHREQADRISQLESENTALRDQLQRLEERLSALETLKSAQ